MRVAAARRPSLMRVAAARRPSLMRVAARYMELGDLCRAIDEQITKCAHFPNEQVFPPLPCTCTSTPVPAAAPLPAPTHTSLLQEFLYLYQVCEALAYTHSMGIIHRCSAPLPALPCVCRAVTRFAVGTSSPRTFL